MTVQTRVPFKLPHPGPYLAIVKNHLDPGYMGSLEVALIKGTVDDTDTVSGQSVKVNYLSPFGGVTSIKHVKGTNAKSFDDTQKSYGMWMIPPDIGTTVMVIFVDGDYNQGYWLGCIQDKFQNFMTPGIAAQELPSTWLTSDQKAKYGSTTYLPVAEYNKRATKNAGNISDIPRPVHPFADRLAEQGLLADRVRGVTSSSARREIPSMVFGISTPGPLDKAAPKGSIEYNGAKIDAPVSRKGGSTFVMDDGDENGNNELVRIRTRTGHQILMHNTSDLIYIANAKGTAWIELTGNGKIDIYAQDSVSIHTEADFNFRADRDINLEAGRNINMHAFSNLSADIKGDLSMLIAKKGTITANAGLNVNSSGNVNIKSSSDLFIQAIAANIRANDTNITAAGSLGLLGGSGINLTSALISNNDPGQAASIAGTADDTKATALPLFAVPFKTGASGWTNGFSAGTLNSALQRVPTHEPWPQHETLDNPFPPDQLDTTLPATGSTVPPSTLPNATPVPIVDSGNALVFTGGSGDEAHFLQSTPELQAAVRACAVSFKQQTGRPVVLTSSFRSKAEQKKLYDGWVAGGGSASNPKVNVPGVGNVMTPVNPDGRSWPNAHARGIGFDSPNCAELDRMGILAANGLYRPVPGPDPVHAVLKNPPVAPNRPSSKQGTVNSE